MKVTHITTIDSGGAYKAAERLHEGMRSYGIESYILVRTKRNRESVAQPVFRSRIGENVSRVKNVLNMMKADGKITGDFLGTDISGNTFIQKADIIVLHWVNSFLSPGELRRLFLLCKPIIWVMHDMWLFTGGCHIDGYCGRYVYGCGNCPQVKHPGEKDLSWRNFKIKENLLREMQGVIVGPSRWVAECASQSSILKGKNIYHIPNMLNTNVFRHLGGKEKLKARYRLDADRTVLLFGAADAGTGNANKGFRYLQKALEMLNKEEYQLAIFGNIDKMMEGLGEDHVRQFGYITDEQVLTEIYNAVDLFITPSLQESFGYTTCEAMACGTPVVAFDIGGLRDQITHKKTGYLARRADVEDLAAGIVYCRQNIQVMREELSGISQRYSYESIMLQYVELMERLLYDMT